MGTVLLARRGRVASSPHISGQGPHISGLDPLWAVPLTLLGRGLATTTIVP